MSERPMRSAALLACVLVALPADAQTSNPVSAWLEEHQVSIRKTFDGKSKDEAEPARIAFNQPDAGSTHYLVDLGIKFGELDLCPSCTNLLAISYPILEWHRSSQEAAPLNKVKLGGAVELQLGDLARRRLVSRFVVKTAYRHDAERNVGGSGASLLYGLMGANKRGGGNTWLPMSQINDSDGNLWFRYAPYVGAEYYNNGAAKREGLPIIGAVELAVFAVHLQLDFYPFNRAEAAGWFEIVVSGAYRERLGGHRELGERLYYGALGVNLYLDDSRHFALGFDLESGRSPRYNFDDQRSISVAFKAKF